MPRPRKHESENAKVDIEKQQSSLVFSFMVHSWLATVNWPRRERKTGQYFLLIGRGSSKDRTYALPPSTPVASIPNFQKLVDFLLRPVVSSGEKYIRYRCFYTRAEDLEPRLF